MRRPLGRGLAWVSWLGWAAAVALPVISATCPGQHTWTANGVVEGTFEGHTNIKWQEPDVWMEEAHNQDMSFDDLLHLSWIPGDYPGHEQWYYKCKPTCVFRNMDPDARCERSQWVCGGPYREDPHSAHHRTPDGAWKIGHRLPTSAGTPPEQLARLKEAMATHDYRHAQCPEATRHAQFLRELPAHHNAVTIKLGAAPGHQTLSVQDTGSTNHGPHRRSPSCPVWPLILWESVPEAVAVHALRTLASRAGVRVIEVMRMRWQPEPMAFARCNALFYAPRLNNPSASHVWFYWLQINQMYKKGTGPFLVVFLHYDCSRSEGSYKQRFDAYRKFFLDTLAKPLPNTSPPIGVNVTLLKHEPMFVYHMPDSMYELQSTFERLFHEERNHRNITDLLAGKPEELVHKDLTKYEDVAEKMRIGYVWNGTIVDDPRNVTCPDFVYPRETMFGRHIPAHNLHHPIVRGLPGAFRMPRGKWMCDEKEWRRCVRSPSKYGFQPSREGEGGFYGRWEKPWTFGDTPFKLLPYRDQAKQASVPRGGGTVTRVRKLTRGRLEGKKYVIPANKTEATRWYTSGKPL